MDIQQKAREYADCKSCEDKKFCSGHKWNENACNKHQGFITGATLMSDELDQANKQISDLQQRLDKAVEIVKQLYEALNYLDVDLEYVELGLSVHEFLGSATALNTSQVESKE